jgi:hypothetical protein
MACPILPTCALHVNISMKEALRVWQSFYCEGSYARCERFKLAASGGAVPPRLLPNGRLLDVLEETGADADRRQP